MKTSRAERFVLLVAAILFVAVIGSRAMSGRNEAALTISTRRTASVSDVMRGGDEEDATDSLTMAAIGSGEENTEISDGADAPGTAENFESANRDAAETANFERVNINTAGVDELSELPGIGEVLAGRIIEYREEYGAFTHISDLLDVNGIGFKTYENISPYICI